MVSLLAILRHHVQHLASVKAVFPGFEVAGPIARMCCGNGSTGSWLRWLVAPQSTRFKVCPVRTGISAAPEWLIGELLERMVPGS